MKKMLITSLVMLFSGFLKGLNPLSGMSMGLTRLKMKLIYIKSIKTFRLLFISLMGVGVCLIFLLAGLVLFHVTLFSYTSLSIQAKMYTGFILSAIYFLVAFLTFVYIFSQNKWMEIFHAQHILNELNDDSVLKKPSQDDLDNSNGPRQSAGANRL